MTSEANFIKHSCRLKNRWDARDERANRMGFAMYQRFYLRSFGAKDKPYTDFIASNYYLNFVAFGKHLSDMQAIRPEDFLDFLLKAKVPIKNWTVDFIYDQYVRELNKKESPSAAVERTILLFQQWSQESGSEWFDFFRHIHPNQAVAYIRSGRISPWILYTAPSAALLLNSLNDEQLLLIQKYVDPIFWEYKFDQEKEYVKFVKEVLLEYGL